MALTIEQVKSLGFKPARRGNGLSKTRKFDTLLYRLNDTDFLYIGYSPFRKEINNKVIWKSFKQTDGNRITYPVVQIGDTTFSELRDYLERCDIREIQRRSIEDCPVLQDPSEWEPTKHDIHESLSLLAEQTEINPDDIPDGVIDSWSKERGINGKDYQGTGE